MSAGKKTSAAKDGSFNSLLEHLSQLSLFLTVVLLYGIKITHPKNVEI
jgi:hypothetical protein